MFKSIGGLGELALVEGDFADAQRLAEESLALCRQKQTPGETSLALDLSWRDPHPAWKSFAAADTLFGRGAGYWVCNADSYWRVVVVRADLGDLAVAEGKPGEALRFYRESLPILLQRGIFAHPQGSLRLACLASAVGQYEVATTLLGACSKAVESGLEVLLPITQADFDRALIAAQNVLVADAFEDAWATGRSLGPQSAVVWGLQAIRASKQQMPV